MFSITTDNKQTTIVTITHLPFYAELATFDSVNVHVNGIFPSLVL